MHRCTLPLLALSTLLVLSTLLACAEDKPAAGKEALSVQSAYLAQPLLGAHALRLDATLGGGGTLALDPNTCRLDAFGDATICTRMAARSIEVRMRQVKVADPAKRGRRLFALQGELPKGVQVHVVVAPGGGAHRLIVTEPEDRRTVLLLEPVPATPAAK